MFIDADAHEVVSHFLDVTRFVLNLVGNWIRPFVVNPAASWAFSNLFHLSNEILAVLIFEINQVFAN